MTARIKSIKSRIAAAAEALQAEPATEASTEPSGALWDALDPLPTPARTIILLVGRLAAYAVCAVAVTTLTASLLAVALHMGMNAFIAMSLYYFTVLLGVLASCSLADAAINYLAEGRLSNDIDDAAGWVGAKAASFGNLFRRNATVH